MSEASYQIARVLGEIRDELHTANLLGYRAALRARASELDADSRDVDPAIEAAYITELSAVTNTIAKRLQPGTTR